MFPLLPFLVWLVILTVGSLGPLPALHHFIFWNHFMVDKYFFIIGPLITNANKSWFFNFAPITILLTKESHIMCEIIFFYFWVQHQESTNWMFICVAHTDFCSALIG